MKQSKNKKPFKTACFPYVICMPAVIIFTCFVLVPFIMSGWISLYNWNGMGKMKFIGIKNFWFVIRDGVFWQAMRHTFIYAIVVTVVKNILGLVLAMLIKKNFVGRTALRVTLFLPVTFSAVVIGVLWTWIYNPNFGLLNSFLKLIGADGLIRGWLSDPKIALYSICLVDIWKWAGFHMMLYLAGLQAIPQSLYDAAKVDGANRAQSFWHVTIPQLNSTIVINVLMSITGAFVSNYDIVNVMTDGGPFHSTEVALTYIIRQAFELNAFGKACAMSVVLFLFVVVFGFLQVKSMSHDENYDFG